MEKISFPYSTKNIPIPSNTEYIKRLIEKVEDFTKRLRWRVFYFMNPNSKPNHKETYGFKSPRLPPFVPQLKSFEDDLLALIEGVRFRKINSPLQKELRKDVRRIQNEQNILVSADKTNNHYSVPPKQYEKLMMDSITSTYKKADQQAAHSINIESRKIAEDLELADRIQALAPKPAYVTLKDHKDNFRTHPTCRLINPSKSEIGVVSKKILDRINADVIKATRVNQWKNTTAVINWFKAARTRSISTFITFDVVNFYPSISRTLLKQALDFASKFTTITPSETEIIFHTKDTLLFHDNHPWQKANAEGLFDVTMGSYDGAETCELVGSFLLAEISALVPKEDIGLYRDDGLAIVHKPPRAAENMKKKLCEKFRQFGLQITANANATVVDFLDVTLDIDKKEFKPYAKQENPHLYVHTESNHPPVITKRIPQSIQTRLSNISSSEEIFNDAKPAYEEALRKAGHKPTLTYIPKNNSNTNSNTDRAKRQRKRNITWFNPPYSEHVTTNIGKKFLGLINKHFPKENQLSRIINRNTVKLSYSCMDNMATIVKAHNNKISRKDVSRKTATCNCRKKEECPLPGRCTATNLVYEAKVHTPTSEKIYIGLTSTTFKTRFATHKSSFANKEKRHQTELSKHIWDLKDEGTPYTIKWRTIRHAQPYSPSTRRCNLCLWEKYYIITAEKSTILNSRTELISTCKHKKTHMLSLCG